MSPKDALFPAAIVNGEIISNSNTSTVVALKGRINGYYAQFWLLFVFRHTETAPNSCEFTLSLLKVKEKLKTWTCTHYCCHYVSKEGQNKLTSKKKTPYTTFSFPDRISRNVWGHQRTL